MTNDIIIIIVAIIVLLVFSAIVIYWYISSNKDYVIDKSIEGQYTLAALNQRCTVGNTQQNVTLLPQYFEPQPCGYNLECVLGDSGAVYGTCKSVIGGICNSIYDCAPNPNMPVYCNNTCNGVTGGVLFSSCGFSGSVGGGNVCDASLGLVCVKGTCLYEDGKQCNNSLECQGGLCAPLNGVTGATGYCLSPIPPAQPCYVDYCQSGFGCDLSGQTPGYCQPKPKTGTIISGKRGAFCNIPLYPGGSNTLSCDAGLICNFEADTMTPSVYPGITGYGLCDIPNIPAATQCSSVGGACIPPNVCYDGICQAPRENAIGFPNINYCGYGSTTVCGDGYECVSDYCLPNSNTSLCNGSSGLCQNSLTCSSDKIGVFTPVEKGQTGTLLTGNYGIWSYIDLPAGETAPSNQSQVSVYQYLTIQSGLPVTKTRLAYLPYQIGSSLNVYFWFVEFEIDSNNNISPIVWQKINITYSFATAYTVFGVKFTTSGNISIYYYSIINQYTVSVFDTNAALVSNTLDIITNALYNAVFGANVSVVDWDVDDTYNVVSGYPSIVGLGISSSISDMYYGSITVGAPFFNNITNLLTFTNDNVNKVSTFVKYIYNYNNNPANDNFMYNGTAVGDSTYSLYINNVTGATGLKLDEPTCNGVGSFFTFTNNVENFEIYYAADRGFRYFNGVFNNATTKAYNTIDVAIEGYIPDYDLSSTPPPLITGTNTVRTLSYGNLDRRLFTLVKLCA